ncbi:Putative transcriptional regulator (plasmid) [Sinorhizobium fredii HH103]|uniref:Transcriptional regulator n=1 Tax=Sinorhizobium fredii (strain HH103) TaxID=1117943 RepID=G9AJ68_SINF1|nr:helix-turn-helix transcriptional regulator [Sinorhizobium fredii]CCF01100.1 Putative transcriptional regulator [Sinorhizobium fredii HH103]
MSSSLPARKKPDPIDSDVGRKIRMQRLLLHMSQTDLAQALDITYQQVQKYENGRTRVSASRLQAIANALEVPLATFFENSSTRDDSSGARLDTGRSLAEFVASPMGLALNRAFARITDAEVRRAFLGLVTRVAEPERKHKQ